MRPVEVRVLIVDDSAKKKIARTFVEFEEIEVAVRRPMPGKDWNSRARSIRTWSRWTFGRPAEAGWR